MEDQIQSIENELGYITMDINSAANEEERKSLEDKYNQQITSLVNQLEQLKNN